MAGVQDIAALLMPQQNQEPPMGALAMVQQARQQLATQPQRLAPPPPSDADTAAMMPETYVNPAVEHILGSLASLPKRAIEGAAAYTPGSGEIPEGLVGASLESAMLPMGTGAIAGVPVRAGETVLGTGPIRAYHGSPHDFDKFSLDKIGTGEGAQAYGHGLYFAENEGTAKAYRDQLSGKPVTLPSDVDSPLFKPALREAIANNSMQVAGRDVEVAKKQLTDQISQYPQGSNARADYEAALDMLHENPHKFAGRMYEVNINADPEHFLDWDKPLSEQHPAVKSKLDASGLRFYDGTSGDFVTPSVVGDPAGEAYQELSQRLGNKAASATERLQEAGIPGIKYLDRGSRAAGEGSRNYVLFNDNLVDIARKYGMGSLAALPPAILGAVQSNDGRQ